MFLTINNSAFNCLLKPVRYFVFLAAFLVVVVTGCSTGSSADGSFANELPTAEATGSIIGSNVDCGLAGQNLQQELLTLINQSRSQPRQCGTTSFPVAAEVILNNDLNDAAQKHSDDMAGNNFFSHTGSDGLTASDRISAAGYNWYTIGENIAAGQPNSASVVQGWLESPDHCENIMSADFTEMGAACTTDASSDFDVYWTIVFARSLNQ